MPINQTPLAKEFDQWKTTLQALSRQPLDLCPDFPRLAQRYEAWWQQECLDRPLLIGLANKNPSRPITRRLDLLEQPEQWLGVKLEDLSQQARTPDTLPNIRVDFGAAALGALLGAKTDFASDTTWTHSFINDDWSNGPEWVINPDNRWWKVMLRLLDEAAQRAKGRFLVCTPNLGGASDVLTNLRGATETCTDVLEQPQRLIEAMIRLQPAWLQAFCELYRRVLGHGAGLVHWHLLWSEIPYVISECDLSYSLGPEDYARICLPDIERQAQTTGRSIYHLDGPGSTRHIDRLLEIPQIKAVQYTPGAGAPSAVAWLEMFQKIQREGRSVLIYAPIGEVMELASSLKPEGLAIAIEGPAMPEQLQAVFAQWISRFH